MPRRRRELPPVSPGQCPECQQSLDLRQHCCWRCHWRACQECGKNTASAFIAACDACSARGVVANLTPATEGCT
jgi:hypothetical protein